MLQGADSPGDGEIDGHRLLPAKSVEKWSHIVVEDVDAIYEGALTASATGVTPEIIRRTLGYLANVAEPGQDLLYGPAAHAFGHDGFGGQLGFGDREQELAVGFVRSALTFDHRFSRRLLDATYECIAASRR